MTHPADPAQWVTCTTHRERFPLAPGCEDDHKAGPLGEQNTHGACTFTYEPASPPLPTEYDARNFPWS